MTNIDNSVLNLKSQFNTNINNKYKIERKSKFNSAMKIEGLKQKIEQ